MPLYISESIRNLEKDWYEGSLLVTVLFESGASARTMIASGEVDLEGHFAIYLRRWDGAMDFPGYSVSIIPSIGCHLQNGHF
jgi:hypothetical protein